MRRQTLTWAMLLAFLAAPVFAQKFTATIRGTVTDVSSGVVVGAKVTLKGEDTGLTKTAITNSTGSYAFGELPVGSYQITVEKEGFKTSVSKSIVLNAADAREIAIQLEAGAIAETITIEAAPVAVKTGSSDISGLVNGEQVRELPLNGRNFVQLALLMPGVSQVDNFNTKDKGLMTGTDMSISGGSSMSNVFTVDGVNNNDVGSNRTILIYPSVDAIEEIKVHRNSYGAEFGQAGGGQISVVTRSGSNDFHGSAYYFGRRDALNATNYFLKKNNKDKEKLTVHDFGFTFGGPLIKDKLHFFASQEWDREKRGTVRAAIVPTLAERQGDFSGARSPGCGATAPIDPLTGAAFPGNVIPSDRLSPGGLAFLKLYPEPNTPLGATCQNWIASITTPINWRQDNGRIDWSITPTTQLMVRYTHDSWKNGSPSAQASLWGDDPFPAVDSTWDQPGRSLAVQLNKTIGATAVNSLQFSYSANSITVARADGNGAIEDAINSAIPTVFPVSGKHYGTGDPHPVFWGGAGLSTPVWNMAPFRNNQDLFVLKDDYSQVFGNHILKIGALAGTNKKNEDVGGSASFEQPQFWGAAGLNGWGGPPASGNTIADFLIKDMAWGFSETNTQPRAAARWKDFEAYASDSWKVHPNVTLDLGLRWSLFPNPYDESGIVASFNAAAFNPALGNDPCNGLLVPPGTSFCQDKGFKGGSPAPSKSLTDTKYANFAPRLGLAWDVHGNGKMAIRAGLGRFYLRERVNILLAQLGNPPFTQTVSGLRKLDTSAEPCAGCFAIGNGSPANGRDPAGTVPSNWQWNFAIERELFKNSTLELAYVGNKGVDITRKYDANEVAPANRLAYVHAPDGGTAATLRPFGVFGDTRITIHDHSGSSIYHALQTQFISRFGNGSQFQASYTFSKLIDDATGDVGNGLSQTTITDLSNLAIDRGVSPLSRRHVFNASLVLNGPSLSDKTGLTKSLFGNWELTSTVIASSGQPLTVYVGSVGGISNGPAGTGFGDNQRPNRVPGVSCTKSDSSNPEIWLNPDAFTLVGYKLGTNGDAGRGICDGPGIFQMDAALYKTINLGGRVKAQLRFEVFNVLNHNQFWGLTEDGRHVMNVQNATFDTGSARTANTITGYTLPGTFGVASRVRDPRQAQVGLKLMF